MLVLLFPRVKKQTMSGGKRRKKEWEKAREALGGRSRETEK